MDEEGNWDMEEDANIMWNSMANCMRRISREVLGESKGKRSNSMETLRWRDEVQAVVKMKKECFKSGKRIELKKILRVASWLIRMLKK